MSNSYWSEQTGAAALFLAVIVVMLGLGIMLTFGAYIIGSIILVIGGAIAYITYLVYRM